ncbi:MAG: alpha-hydroxy-acid oxidizing protein [Actinomycetota bacterium]|nr:alpha-hydroxy-acid oxidizing protein [Actinomycetota bacterium]
MSDVGGPSVLPPFHTYQAEIFLRGMAGERPTHPIALAELEGMLEGVTEPHAAAYVLGGAGMEDTMRANEAAFRRWRIVPRILCDVSERDLSVTALGTPMPAPVALAPIGVQTIVHPEGELAVARAAGAAGLVMSVSTVAGSTLEEIAAVGGGPKWFQLYWPRNHELAESLVSRAERAGYKALLVTLDVPMQGWRPRDLQSAWQPFLTGIGLANYYSDPVFRSLLERAPEDDRQAAVLQFVYQFTNPELGWGDLERLRAMTSLPIALKGVLHPDDARLAREHGVDGIVVSNHGGRQVDGAVASLDALPRVLEAAGNELEVLLDSGIRSGADVVKALALGARAVLLGRPYLWGLALGGEAGVLQVLRAILAELDLTVGFSGHTRADALDPGVLVREG